MAKYTVVYGTNTMIPDEKGNLRSITFFQEVEGKTESDVEWIIEQQLELRPFIKDKGGYLRRTNTIVSYKLKEITTRGKN